MKAASRTGGTGTTCRTIVSGKLTMGFRALLTAKPYHHASHKPSPSLKMSYSSHASHTSHLQWQSAKLHSCLFRHCAIATEKMAILVNGIARQIYPVVPDDACAAFTAHEPARSRPSGEAKWLVGREQGLQADVPLFLPVAQYPIRFGFRIMYL